MKQNDMPTNSNNLPSILTYIALVLIVTFSQEKWDSWDFLVGFLGVFAFGSTTRIIRRKDKLELFCNALLFGISAYILFCASCVFFGYLVEPRPAKPAIGVNAPITGEQMDALLRWHLSAPGCTLEDWWWVITFGFGFLAFILTYLLSKDESTPTRPFSKK